MDEHEQPMDDDDGAWAYQLELEQQFYEEVINYVVTCNEAEFGKQ